MTEFILPISVPGAGESAAKMRTFKTEAAGAAVATDATAKAATGLGKALATSATATTEATAKNKAHIRTLDEEITRLKMLEHQAAITAKAKLALGESGNAGDISAIRRFGRSLPGGIGREIGRGAAEGLEGAEGTGLKATLGTAGAVVATTMVGLELLKLAAEASAEGIHRETEERAKLSDILQAGQKSAATGGEDYLRRNGAAMKEIVANGGDAALARANKWADDTKDPTALAAFADMSKRMPGKYLNAAISIAEQEHALTGKSLSDAGKGLNVQRLDRQEPGTDQILREDMGDTEFGLPLTPAELDARRKNLKNSTSLGAVMTQEADDAGVTAANRDHAGMAKAASGKRLTDARNPSTGDFLDKRSKGDFAESEELRKNAEDELTGRGLLAHPLATAWLGITEWGHRHGVGKGSYTQRYNEANDAAAEQASAAVDKDAEMISHLREAAASLSAAADAREGGGSAGQAGAAP